MGSSDRYPKRLRDDWNLHWKLGGGKSKGRGLLFNDSTICVPFDLQSVMTQVNSRNQLPGLGDGDYHVRWLLGRGTITFNEANSGGVWPVMDKSVKCDVFEWQQGVTKKVYKYCRGEHDHMSKPDTEVKMKSHTDDFYWGRLVQREDSLSVMNKSTWAVKDMEEVLNKNINLACRYIKLDLLPWNID